MIIKKILQLDTLDNSRYCSLRVNKHVPSTISNRQTLYDTLGSHKLHPLK